VNQGARLPLTRCLSSQDFARPVDDRWFEDYSPGAVYEYGWLHVPEQELVSYAERYDPQPIHTDPEFAARGPFGGLIASGMHTIALATRLMIDHYLSRVASMASPGIEQIAFLHPVRPDDRLMIRTVVDAARLSASKPDRGVVRTRVETVNQEHRSVASFVAVNFLRRQSA
jgi:acyl dehydratase